MMKQIINVANVFLQTPADWHNIPNGKLATFQIRASQFVPGIVQCETAWEPTPGELTDLLSGGSVILRSIGGQSPVELYVIPRVESAPD